MNQVAEEVVETVPSGAAGPSGDGMPKLDGISEPEQGDRTPQGKDRNGNTLDNEQQTVQLKSNNARSDIEVANNAEISKSETDTGAVRRRRGRKPNSLMRPEEGYEHPWTMGGKDSCKLSYDGNNREMKDLLPPLEPGKSNILSDSSLKEFDSINEGSVGKRGRSKRKEMMTNEQDNQEQSSKQRRKILQPKVKVRGSNTPKRRTKRVVATDSDSKDELLLQELSVMKEIKDEIISPKHESGDDVDKVMVKLYLLLLFFFMDSVSLNSF